MNNERPQYSHFWKGCLGVAIHTPRLNPGASALGRELLNSVLQQKHKLWEPQILMGTLKLRVIS
jgi:hypothetical protein